MAKKIDKDKQNIYKLIGVGAVGTLGFFGIKYIADKAKPKTAAEPPKISTASRATTTVRRPATSAWTDGTFPLRQGMSNTNKVKYLQMALIRAGLLPAGADDGDFGPKTAAALKSALIDPDNGVSVNSYNGLLQKYGLPQYLVTISGQYVTSVPAMSNPLQPAIPSTISSGVTAGAATPGGTVLASGRTVDSALARLRMMDKGGYFVTLADALGFISTYLANANDYRLVDAAWRGASGKTLYNTFASWTWSAGNLALVTDALKKKGGLALAGVPVADATQHSRVVVAGVAQNNILL